MLLSATSLAHPWPVFGVKASSNELNWSLTMAIQSNLIIFRAIKLQRLIFTVSIDKSSHLILARIMVVSMVCKLHMRCRATLLVSVARLSISRSFARRGVDVIGATMFTEKIILNIIHMIISYLLYKPRKHLQQCVYSFPVLIPNKGLNVYSIRSTTIVHFKRLGSWHIHKVITIS